MTLTEAQSLSDIIKSMFNKPTTTGKAQQTAVSSLRFTGSSYLQPKLNPPIPKAPPPRADGLDTMMNYQDPKELNSFADAMFNIQAINSRKWIRNIPDWAGFGSIIPVKYLAAAADVTYNTAIKPLIGDSNKDGMPDWDFTAVAINGLGNLLETMAIVGNPINGAVIEGFNMNGSTEGLNALQGFSRGLGMGAEGRYQYDYNVQVSESKFLNGATNFALEFISDPLNWVELGAGAVAKGAAKKLSGEMLETAATDASKKFVKTVLESVDDDAVSFIRTRFGDELADGYRVALSQGADAARAYADDIGANMVDVLKNSAEFRRLTKQASREAVSKGTDVYDEMQKAAQRALSNKFSTPVWESGGKKAAQDAVLGVDVVEALKAINKETLSAQTRRVVDAMGQLYRVTDEGQKYLLKGVLASNPVGLAVLGAGAVGKKMWSKLGSTQFISKMLAKQFKDTQHIKIDQLVEWNRALERLAQTDPGKAADIRPIAQTITQGTASMYDELSDIMDLIARNSDAKAAQDAIAEYISKQHGNKSVQEYIDELVFTANDASLSGEVRALFAQHALKLNSQFSDLIARVTLNATPGAKHAISLIKSTPVEAMTKFFEQLEVIKQLAIDNKWVYDLASDPTATYDLHTSWKDLVRRTEGSINMIWVPNKTAFDEKVLKEIMAFERFIPFKTGATIRNAMLGLQENIQNIIKQLPMTIPQREAALSDLDVLMGEIIESSFAIKTTAQIKVLEDMVGYVVKNSQLNAALHLMNTKGLDKLVSFINTSGGIEMLEKLNIAINQAAGEALDKPNVQLEYIKNFAKGYETEMRFMDKIVRMETLKPAISNIPQKDIAAALLDAVQTYARRPVDSLIQDYTKILSDVYRRILNQVNSGHATQSNKLADVLSRTLKLEVFGNNVKLHDELLARFGKTKLEFHDADDDAIAALLIAERTHPEVIGHGFAFDIETSPSKHVIQIAWRWGDKSGNYVVKTPPEMLHDKQDLVRKLSGLPAGRPYPDHLKAYQDKFAAGTYSEEEALNAFFRALDEAAAADSDLRLVGHNLKLSDEVELTRRATRTLVDPGVFGDAMYRAQRRVDTYLDEVRKTGHLDFEDEPELAQSIAMELQILLRSRAFELAQLGEPSMTLFEQKDIFLAFSLRSIAGQLEDFGLDASAANAFRTTSMRLMENLRSIRFTNSRAQTILVNKETIPNLATAMGYDANDIGKLVAVPDEYFGPLASRIVVDTAAARTLFDEKFIKDNLFLATEYAKRIDVTYRQMGDVEELLEGKTAQMRTLFKHLQARLPSISMWDVSPADKLKAKIAGQWKFKTDWQVINSSTAKIKALKNLRFPDGTAHQAATLLWLIREVKDSLNPVGAANVSQTLMTQLRSAIGEAAFDKDYAYLFNIFDTGFRLYDVKVRKQASSVIDEAKRMAQSIAVMNAETTLKECAILKKFNNQQYDYIGQFYRFDKKYELAFASEMMDSMDGLLDAVNKYATIDTELTHRQLFSYYDAVGKTAAKYVLNLRGAELLAHLQFNAHGVVRIDLTDWAQDTDMIKLVRTFMADPENAGIGIKLHNRKLWIAITSDSPAASYEALRMADLEDDLRLEQALPEELLLKLQDTRQKIHAVKTAMRKLVDKSEDDWMYNMYSVNSTGSLISSQELDALLADMPTDLAKKLRLPSAPRDTFNFNYSNIGSPAARNLAYNFSATNPVRAYNSVLQTYLAYGDAAMKMRVMLTSESSFVRFSNLFEDMDDQEILNALQSSRIYRVLMAEQDKSVFGYHVRELKPSNLDDIKMLRTSEAIVVDHNTHRMLRNVFNRGELNNGFAKFFNDVVVSPAKAGMLTGIGPVLRNFVDSTLKNYMSLDYMSDAPAFTGHTIQAIKWLNIYETDMKQILKMTLGHYDEIKARTGKKILAMGPSKAGIEAYFSALDLKAKFLGLPVGSLMAETDPDIIRQWDVMLTDAQKIAIEKAAKERGFRRDIFDLTHTFIAQGPSAGYIEQQQQMIKGSIEAKRKELGQRMDFQESVKHFAWSNPMTAPLMSVQSKIEQVARFSKFTWELKNDRSVAEAMHRVIETHFDYETKSTAVMYMELIIPFYTFAVANMEYWSKLMSRHGWPFGVLRDLYSSFMDFNEYDQYEMQNNRAVQYALLNGTVPLSDTGFSMKLSPSYLDAFNILMQPFGSVQQRIAKAVSIPLQVFYEAVTGELVFNEKLLKDVLSAVPFVGNYTQRYWKSEDWSLMGSARRAAEGVAPGTEEALALLVPTVFSDVGKAYYFAYPSTNEVWKTYDEDVYFEQMSKGASPVITNEQAQEIEAREKYTFYYGEKEYSTYNYEKYQQHLANGAEPAAVAPMDFYYGDKKYTTYKKATYEEHLAKGATTEPGQKKTPVSFRTSTGYSRRSDAKYDYDLVYRNGGSQIRQFGRTLNLSHIAPAIWRRVYTAGANDRFKVRLTKPRAKNLQYRIRMDWRYWR